MSKPGYIQIRNSDARAEQLRRIEALTGASGPSAVVDFALAYTLAGLQPRATGELKRIDVRYSRDAIFGDADPVAEGIDVDASLAEYERQIAAMLQDQYPEADFSVVPGNGSIQVNHNHGHIEIDHIQAEIEAVWERWDWLRYK